MVVLWVHHGDNVLKYHYLSENMTKDGGQSPKNDWELRSSYSQISRTPAQKKD